MAKTIMIVDDEPDVIYTIKQGLEKLNPNYKVVGAESGKKCLDFLENNQIPDLILLDIMMPDMSGWEVLNRLREKAKWRNIPVVFLSAKTDTFSKTFGITVAMDYIEKPFEIVDVKNRIEKVFQKITPKKSII
jgi:putative two-component system response regulator